MKNFMNFFIRMFFELKSLIQRGKSIYVLLWCIFFSPSIFGKKNLVLIISSDDQPVYRLHKESWRIYMNAFEGDFESYFLQYDDSLKEEFYLDGDTLWLKGKESVCPGCLEKTVKAFQYFLNRKEEFDYVIRPNLSSFIILPRLKDFLKDKPKTQFYGGYLVDHFISGACFMISTDLMESMVVNKEYFMGRKDKNDDEIIGEFLLHKMFIQPFHHPNFQFIERCRPKKIALLIPKEIFHFRVKYPPNREAVETIIVNDLLNIFYPTIMLKRNFSKKFPLKIDMR
jgi:hypothetical protein